MVLDTAWWGPRPWATATADLLVQFFAGKGLDTYGSAYTLDGATLLDATRDQALVAANGATAMISSLPTSPTSPRYLLVNAVWNMDPPTGPARYYSGLLDLLALLVLGGEFQVL